MSRPGDEKTTMMFHGVCVHVHVDVAGCRRPTDKLRPCVCGHHAYKRMGMPILEKCCQCGQEHQAEVTLRKDRLVQGGSDGVALC